jgi:hypothetical protein
MVFLFMLHCNMRWCLISRSVDWHSPSVTKAAWDFGQIPDTVAPPDPAWTIVDAD